MITKIEIQNYRSILDRQVLDLRSDPPRNTDGGNGLGVPSEIDRTASSIAVIFGAHASGKSTILRALRFLANFISNSFEHADDWIFVESFAHSEMRHEETSFHLEFGGVSNKEESGLLYLYELRIQHSGSHEESFVSYEALSCQLTNGARRKMFERTAETYSVFTFFGFEPKEVEHCEIRRNASLISTLAHHGHQQFGKLKGFFGKFTADMCFYKISLDSDDIQWATELYGNAPLAFDLLRSAVRTIDVDIDDVELVTLVGGQKEAFFKRSRLENKIVAHDESQGIRRFYVLFAQIAHAVITGGVAIIDDIDAHLHPHMVQELFTWFQDRGRNLREAQLLATCHSAVLLEGLEKEQVFFTEKGDRGETSIHRFRDIKDLRMIDPSQAFHRIFGRARRLNYH